MKLSSGLHAAAGRQAYVLLIYSYGASVQERVCAEGRVKHTRLQVEVRRAERRPGARLIHPALNGALK